MYMTKEEVQGLKQHVGIPFLLILARRAYQHSVGIKVV